MLETRPTPGIRRNKSSTLIVAKLLDLLRRIPGVGRVSNIGSRYYAMQIWALPDKLANVGLTVQDLQNALKDQNRESAAGVLGQPVSYTHLDVYKRQPHASRYIFFAERMVATPMVMELMGVFSIDVYKRQVLLGKPLQIELDELL